MHKNEVKVAHIVEGLDGGLNTYMCTVLPQLVQNGFDVTLICSLNRGGAVALKVISELREKGIKVHVVEMCREINAFKDMYSFISILQLLLKGEFDIIHTHCSKAGALGRLAAFVAHKNVRLHSPHCFAFLRCGSRFKKILYLMIERLLGRVTTRLVAVSKSEAVAATHLQIVPPCECIVVENGISESHFPVGAAGIAEKSSMKTRLGLREDTQVVATACRFVEYKGIFRFLRAAQISKTPNAVFLIAGEGELRNSVEDFINKNKLGSRVRLLGQISYMESIYAISDVVALCSDAEGQPYLLLEAMRAGCAVVATEVFGSTELIQHGKTGLLTESTPKSITAAIDELLADKGKRDEYAKNAYSYICRCHSLEKQVSELTRIYKSFVNKAQEQYASVHICTR